MIRKFNRRALLSGAGLTIALPFLETLAPKKALGQQGAAPKRFVGYYVPNGFDMDDWRPIGTGSAFQLGPMMGAPREFDDGFDPFPQAEQGPGLDAVKQHLLILSGLQNTRQPVQGDGDHAGGTGAFMTSQTVSRGLERMAGPSIDYLLSKVIGQESRLPYLAFGGQGAHGPGSTCDLGYNCVTGGNISFDDDGVNLARRDSPDVVFDELFVGLDPATTSAEALARWRRDVSILDAVLEDSMALNARLSYQDRPVLDRYMTSVNEIERRIKALMAGGGVVGTIPERPGDVDGDNSRATIDVYHELMALGLQNDATRVMSFMWGNLSSNRNHAFIGAEGGHHEISHHGGAPNNVNRLKRIGYWWFRRFGEFLTRLSELPDIDGRSVLDNTLIFNSSEISDGDAHSHTDMPVVLAGGAAGFKLGQHLVLNDSPWFAQLFISIAQSYGVELTTFGQEGTGTGPLTGLT